VSVVTESGITVEEMDASLAAPPKPDRDYPNNERFLQFLYGMYRRFFSK